MIERRKPLKRTPLRAKIRCDCKACRRRLEKRGTEWVHVREGACKTAEPYKTKRTPKRTSLMRQADTFWSQLVKADGRCWASGFTRWPIFGIGPSDMNPLCAGPLEAAHIVPRRHRSTRWLVENGRPLCQRHHRYYTEREHEWRASIGPEWDRLWVAAQTIWDGDYTALIARLRAELATMKEAA